MCLPPSLPACCSSLSGACFGRYIRILLASEHIKTKQGERSLLRNLGAWLGLLTLGKSQPVRQKDLDIKKIMYEAYEQGKMIAVASIRCEGEPCHLCVCCSRSCTFWCVCSALLVHRV